MLNSPEGKLVVLFTGAFRFPDKDAAAQRVLGTAKALKAAGFDAVFCGWETAPRNEDLQGNGIYKYSGFEYYSQAELDIPSNNFLGSLYHFLFRGTKTIRWIKRYLKCNRINYIVTYNSFSYFIYRLFRLSKKHGIKLICDCTEWYDGSHLPGGKYGIASLDNNFRIKIMYPLVKNIIVISSYLQTFLESKNCNTIKIPPLIDASDPKWNFPAVRTDRYSYNVRRIIYAGDPGKKDLLVPVLRALELINNSSIHFEFTILGIESHVLNTNYYSGSETIPSYINCIGYVPQDEVPRWYHQSDYSVLLREDKRYSNAGFPTKLVESLISGVPVITNKTSDIPAYIHDNKNGFLLPDTSVQAILECFNVILSLTPAVSDMMRENARKSSLENFDFQLYSNPLKNYFLNVR